jgi:hypothetical protein
MLYASRLKGHLFQGAIKCLFEHANYRVVPYGIEATLREIACMGKDGYRSLDLPSAISLTPDFILLDESQSKKWIVEVKYRQSYHDNDELIQKMKTQVEIFKDVYFVLFIQNPNTKLALGKTPSTHIRTFHSRYENGKLMVSVRINKEMVYVPWERGINKFYSFFNIHEIFNGLERNADEKTLQTTMSIILNLNLDDGNNKYYSSAQRGDAPEAGSS